LSECLGCHPACATPVLTEGGLRHDRTWREGILSLKHRRRNETNKYHPAQQSPYENDWLPGNENVHGRPPRTKNSSNYHYYTAKNPDTFREMSCSSRRRKVFSARDFEHCWVVASEHANRKSHPLRASLAQAEEVRTRRHAGEIDISSQDHNVVFEFSHSTRAEKFSSTRIE
jgi:hypothetical protein